MTRPRCDDAESSGRTPNQRVAASSFAFDLLSTTHLRRGTGSSRVAARLVSAVLLLFFNGTAQAQEDDIYFEAARGARDEGCSGKKSVCYDLLSTHRRNYFITGFTRGTEAKFQFSVKYDLWPNESPSSLHFGYTQKALWNIYRESAPFAENNYNPEIFYTYDLGAHGHAVAQAPSPSPRVERSAPVPAVAPVERPARCSASYVRAGVEHESNGLAGSGSRGWNRVYLSGLGGCDLNDTAYVLVGVKAWAPPFLVSDNPDISYYLGSGELTLALGASSDAWYGSAEVSVTARKGWSSSLGVGSVEVDARWRPSYATFAEHLRFVPYLFGQAFTGYGETLLGYDHPDTSVRVGIGLSGAVRLRR
jgi:outer membrane phospholipase A